MNLLKQEITKLSGGTQSDVEHILSHLKRRSYLKGRFLLRPSQICQQYFFVEQGALRLYHLKEGKDYTVWIATEGQIFTDLDSYLNETPSYIFIECIEPSLVHTIAKPNSEALAARLPAYNTLLRKTVELAFANMARNVVSYQSEDALERYNRLEKEKDWLIPYPLKYISSFIGVTQSTLSKLRGKRK